MQSAFYEGVDKHPQLVMKELGITYRHSTPQSISDEWWFWNCENIPDVLPKYLRVLNINPFDAIGYGLSQQDAEKISQAEMITTVSQATKDAIKAKGYFADKSNLNEVVLDNE